MGCFLLLGLALGRGRSLGGRFLRRGLLRLRLFGHGGSGLRPDDTSLLGGNRLCVGVCLARLGGICSGWLWRGRGLLLNGGCGRLRGRLLEW